MYPKPIQTPLPVHVGGESPAAMRGPPVTARAGTRSTGCPEDLPEALGPLDEALAAEGRSRGDGFSVSLCPYFQTLGDGAVEACASAGVDRLILVCLAGPDDLTATSTSSRPRCWSRPGPVAARPTSRPAPRSTVRHHDAARRSGPGSWARPEATSYRRLPMSTHLVRADELNLDGSWAFSMRRRRSR